MYNGAIELKSNSKKQMEDTKMLKITKKSVQHVANMSGCGKMSDSQCGIRAKMG